MASLLSLAMERLSEASKADQAEDYEQAYQLYIQCLKILSKCTKYTKEKSQKEVIQSKMREVLERAELIQSVLKKRSEKGDEGSGKSSGGGAEKDAGGAAKNKDDERDNRLRGSLESCIVRSSPNVRWDQIAGLEGAKEALQESVVLPVKFPHLFKGKRRPWKGILLYGPPGTGKSYLAKAVATETQGTFFTVSSADLLSRWMGESEKLVRNLFQMARESAAETKKPSIIFVDEIDSLASSRSDGENDASRRVKTEFLVQMQGVGNSADDDGVLMLAATNIPWALDSAIRRRFERRIYIPLPDKMARVQMFKIHMGDTPHSVTEEQWVALAEATAYYSGSDIENVVRNALMEGIRALQIATHFKYVPGPDPHDPQKTVPNRIVPCSPGDQGAFEATMMTLTEPEMLMELPVSYADFRKSLLSAKPSVNQADLAQHEKFTADFGQED
eukprot:gene2330-1465_t